MVGSGTATLWSAWLLLCFLYPVKYLYSGELDGWYSNPVECLALTLVPISC